MELGHSADMVVGRGINWYAVLGAAVAFYSVGFAIYGALFSKLWMKLSGYTREQLQPHMWKMALSPIMPILTAIGLAAVFSAFNTVTLTSGLLNGFLIWLFLILPTRLYSFVYSPERPGLLVMDSVHLLLGFLAAGAILGSWPGQIPF